MEQYKFLAKKYASSLTPPVTGGGEDYPDLINLSIGDPDIPTPKVIIDEAFKDAYAGHTKYTATRGYPELRAEIAAFYKKRYGMSLDDSEIFVSTAGNVGMFLVMQAMLDPGDEVIIFEPCFFPYPNQVKMAGGVPVFVSTTMEEGFGINFDRLEKAVTPRTKAVLINTPNNPTGVVYDIETLEKLARFAKKYDLAVIADDIYTSFVYNGKFIPICSLPQMKERTVTVNSFSKNFIMTGFRVGNIVAPEYIIRAVESINENVVYTAPALSQRAALHGLRHFEEFESDVVNTFRERVSYARERLGDMPFIDVLPPQGSFYIFPSVKKTGLDGMRFAKKLEQERHVRVIPGIAFGESGRDNIRISCTLGKDKLAEAFDRMEKLRF